MTPNRSTVVVLGCFALVLTCSACGLSPLSAGGDLEVVAFNTPDEIFEGGVRLAPPDSRWDGYGEVVDLHGPVMVIGASEWNPCGHGSAYVYRLSEQGWQEETQLTPEDREMFIQRAGRFEGQRFGTSVAVGEGIIAVGAPGNASPIAGDYRGAVYLYEYDGTGWLEAAKIEPNRPNTGDSLQARGPSICSRMKPPFFGSLVALDGDMLAVGGNSDSASVHIFQRVGDGWLEQARLPIPGSPGRDLHMASLALHGDALALSAFYVPPQPEQTPFLTGNAVVYVFERTGDAWKESFRFSPEPEGRDLVFMPEVNVGASVALGGESGEADLLAIGLPGFPDWSGVEDHIGMFGASPESNPELPETGRQSGAVFLLDRGAEGVWTHRTTLRLAGWEDPPGPGALPTHVPSHLDDGQNASGGDGASLDRYVFPGHLFSAAPEVSFFGATVDLDGDHLAVTAGYSNVAYVFERQGEGWVCRLKITPGREGEGLWEDFAQVVAISGPSLLVGTPGEFGNSAHVFNLHP